MKAILRTACGCERTVDVVGGCYYEASLFNGGERRFKMVGKRKGVRIYDEMPSPAIAQVASLARNYGTPAFMAQHDLFGYAVDHERIVEMAGIKGAEKLMRRSVDRLIAWHRKQAKARR